MSLRAGDRLGDWVVDRALGEGGMGSVYRCHSVLADDVRAAVKVLKRSDLGDSQGRFVQELRTLASLNHPAIVRVLGGGRDEKRDLLYMAMELVDGEDLADRIARGALSPDEAVKVFGPVADALAYAHARGVAHRDIKPSNIMVRSDGTPVIVDFGIAVAEGRTRYTKEGLVPGTVIYLPPEIFEGEPPDPKSTDAYALGVVLWEALTGRAPFAADPTSSEGQQLAQVMGLKLRSDALDPGPPAPEHVREAVRRTTDPDPDTRLIDLEAVRDLVTTGEADLPVRRRRRRKKSGCRTAVGVLLALAAAGATLLAVVGVVGVTWWVARSRGGGHVERPPVDLATTLQDGAKALERGDVATARREAGLALDDHPEDPNANLLYGEVLLAGGAHLLARPFLCAAADGGLGEKVPGYASGELDCTRGPGADVPLSAPLALAHVDLSEQVAIARHEVEDARGAAVASADEMAPPAQSRPALRPARAPHRHTAAAPPPPSAAAPATSEPEMAPPVAEESAAPPPPSPPPGGSGYETAKKSVAVPVGDVRIETLTVQGSLEPKATRAVLDASLRRLRACYAYALQDAPQAHGLLLLQVVVGADGQVRSVRTVSDTTGAEGLSGCVEAALRGRSFPTADGQSTVGVAFRLTPPP